MDLVDYRAHGRRLWSLWTNSDNVPVIRVTDLVSPNAAWSDVVLEEGVDPCFSPSLKADARQAYLHKIFRPPSLWEKAHIMMCHFLHKIPGTVIRKRYCFPSCPQHM